VRFEERQRRAREIDRAVLVRKDLEEVAARVVAPGHRRFRFESTAGSVFALPDRSPSSSARSSNRFVERASLGRERGIVEARGDLAELLHARHVREPAPGVLPGALEPLLRCGRRRPRMRVAQAHVLDAHLGTEVEHRSDATPVVEGHADPARGAIRPCGAGHGRARSDPRRARAMDRGVVVSA
jgi:hypothetical protein